MLCPASEVYYRKSVQSTILKLLIMNSLETYRQPDTGNYPAELLNGIVSKRANNLSEKGKGLFEEGEVILNFLAITKGGGLQNSLSFLETLAEMDTGVESFVAVVQEGSELENRVESLGMKYHSVSQGRYSRLWFELRVRRYFRRGQVCFSIFGLPWLGSRGYLVNICGFAYSNLLYPELAFWSYLVGFKRLSKELIDWFRRWGVTGADYWIFESEVLRQRAVNLAGFPANRTGVVRMAASHLVSTSSIQDQDDSWNLDDRCFKFLFLHGGHPNKRQHLLPAIVEDMSKKECRRFKVILTMDESSDYGRKVMEEFKERGLCRFVVNIGPVNPDRVASLIDKVDCMCSFSRLESFSNNYVEAWQKSKPLVVGDGDWARDCCGEGALYVTIENTEETVRDLLSVMNLESLRKKLISGGKRMLTRHPDASEKTCRYFEKIVNATSLGSCSAVERRKIKWP